jgi:O-antigen ligase
MNALATVATIRRPQLTVGVGLLGGALVGLLIAWNPFVGVAALFALLFAPVAATNLPLALSIWVGLIFFEGIPGGNSLSKVAAGVIALAWLGQAARHDSWQRQQLRRHKRMLTLAALFVVWMAVSLIWALDPGRGTSILLSATEVLIMLTLVATVPSRASHLRMMATGFVVGAVLSALIGIVGTSVGGATVDMEGRMQGAAGDPNFFASQMVAAMVLAVGLFATTPRLGSRLLLGAALVPLASGLIASGSRGGYVALIATGIAAIVVFRRQRAQILLVVAGIAAVMGIWLTNNSAAWHRITSASQDRGSGRQDLWTIGLRVYNDHPLLGVGLNNFEVYAPRYTRQPGTLTGVVHIETERGVHNVYLSLLVETGIVGVALFLLLAVGGVMSGVRAGQRLEAAGDPRAAMLARATTVALTGMLSAAFFLSDAEDKRIWVLIGLCLASSGVAAHLVDRRLWGETRRFLPPRQPGGAPNDRRTGGRLVLPATLPRA